MNIITARKMAFAPFNSSNGLMWLEKAESGQVTVEDISDALEEFARLFKAGISSKAEILTLARAFPTNRKYTEAASNVSENEPMVIGGPASVSLIDREGHLITTDALKKAFIKFMSNFRTRNAMVLHSDVQVGWALPAYITKGGQIFKSGVDDKGLFFICELRDDTKISEKVMKEINEGRLKSYSIAGSALKVQNMQKGLVPYMQVDEMELAEVTVCEKGVNQNAGFELLKAEMPQTGKIDKDQANYRNATMEESMHGENCGHCKFFNSQDKTCDAVTGDIQSGDWCKLFAPMEEQPKHAKVVVVMRDKQKVDFKKSFDMWMEKAETVKDPLKAKESVATLQNFAGREAEHHQLLREYGFPSEQPSESQRYTPVIETETDDKGRPKNLTAPWTVNEAGQDLGEKLDEDSPDYHLSAKAKNRKSGDAVQKMGELFLEKVDYPSDAETKGVKEAERKKGWSPRLKALVARRQKAQTDTETLKRGDEREGGTIPYEPAPGYTESPRGQSRVTGVKTRDAAEAQTEWQRRTQDLNPQARATKRRADTAERSAQQKYFATPTAVDRQASLRQRTDPRGSSYTGARGQTKTESVADKQKREEHESRQKYLQDLRDTSGQDEQAVRAKKQQAGEDSAARRGGLRGSLKRAFQHGSRATQRAAKADIPLDRVAREVGTGLKSGMTGKKLQNKPGERIPTASKRSREVGRTVSGLYRGFKDRPTNEAGEYMRYEHEGKTGERARQVGRKGRGVYDWASGKTPFFSEEVRAKRAADKRFAGSSVQPGGLHGRNMEYDDHVGEFKGHNERVQSTGHDTHENFLHNLQRLGMTKDNKTMFDVRHGKNVGNKMGDTVHAHDFLAGEGKDWDIEIHPDFAQHADEIHKYLGEYKTHMAGAPGRGVGATHGGGGASQTMEWTTPQTEQPVQTVQPTGGATAEIPHGPPAPDPSVNIPARQRQADFLAGKGKFAPQSYEGAVMKKLTKASLLDAMLLKALGVKYATKKYSKTA